MAAPVCSIGEQIGLPLVMIEVPFHVFLRLGLGNGSYLNWDIYLKNNGIKVDDNQYRQLYHFDKETSKAAGYLRPLTRPEMLALEYNAVGVALEGSG